MNLRRVMPRRASEDSNTLRLILLPLLAALLILAAGGCRTPSRNDGKSDVAKADGKNSRSTQSYRSERKVDIQKPKWEEELEDETTATEDEPVAVEEKTPVQPADPVESDLEAIAKNSRELDPPVVKPPMTTTPEIGKRAGDPPPVSAWEDEFIKDMQGVIDSKKARGAMSMDLARRFPVADEIQIGEGVAARILSKKSELDNQALWEYVSFVGLSLVEASFMLEASSMVEASSRHDLAFHFVVLDDPDDINAFAAPGGYVFITSGAIGFCRNEAELASILAHEISHVSLRHGIRALDRAKYRVMMEMMVQEMDEAGTRIFDDMWNTQKSREIEKELSGIADDCYAQTQNPYSRELEIEADREALKLLEKAGYNPYASITLLERLDRNTADQPVFTKALRSHPAPSERVDTLRGAAGAMGLGNRGRLNADRFLPYLEMLNR